MLADGKGITFTFSGPVIVDFDGDGLHDLIVVRERMLAEDDWSADVYFCRNTSSAGRPSYEAPVAIIENYPGLRLKVLPVDYDHDGVLDLLIGDMDANCPQPDYTGYVWFFRGKSTETAEDVSVSNPRESEAKDGSDPVHVTCSATASVIQIDITIDPHWHISSNSESEDGSFATSVKVGAVSGIRFESPRYPEPDIVDRFGMKCAQYEGSIRVLIPYSRIAEGGGSLAEVIIEYQSCGDATKGGVCLMPRTRVIEVVLPSS